MRVSFDAQQAKGSAFTIADGHARQGQYRGHHHGRRRHHGRVMAVYSTSGGFYTPQLPGAGSGIMHHLDWEPRSWRFYPQGTW